MKNIDKIRKEIITYFETASPEQLRDIVSFLFDYDIHIAPSTYLDCTKCEELYGYCGADDLDKDHCKNMFLKYCEEETE